jgi:WD40 repeat protein
MTGQDGLQRAAQVARPRRKFAERFALLYTEAGCPPLKQVTASVARARWVDERGLAVRVSAQRVSDWRRGRNVPARFAVLTAVLKVLIEAARKTRPRPRTEGLYDLEMWRALWEAALASPVTAAEVESPNDPVVDSAHHGVDGNMHLCPYQGLAAFGQADTALFFGRDRVTTALLARLEEALRAGGMVPLVGASGSGKSSLLRAGLVPALVRGTLPAEGSTGWPVVLMVPGTDPVAELASQIPSLTSVLNAAMDTPERHRDFADRVRSACVAHAERCGGPDARLTLIVDQFEETFTQCVDRERRRIFVEALHAVCTPSHSGDLAPGAVLLGLRADFYGRCLQYPELAESLQDRQMVLGPMTTPELRDVIVGPAKAAGLQPEAGLVELLLRDLRGGAGGSAHEVGALPLLSHALLATWQRRQAGKLTVSGYRAAGGIHGAVAATAERAWAELRPDEHAATRRLLLRLVRIDEDAQDTRRRAPREELMRHVTDGVTPDHAIDVLARHRLITLDAGSVEITHEAVLSAWPRLRRWIDQDRAANLARQRLEEDAAVWERQSREPSLLYRGARLENMRHRADPVDLTAVARDFLATSARHRRRTVWFRRAAVTTVVIFAVIAAILASVAVQQRDDAIFRQVLAEADRLHATDQSLSAQLNLVAHGMRPDDVDVYARLISTGNTPLATPLVGHQGSVYLTSFSPDGRILATASYDHTVRLWDVRDRTRPVPIGKPLTGHTSWVSTAVFSPDGGVLATAGDDHTIRLWDVRDPADPAPIGKPFGGDNGTIYLMAFSPDGHTLATANEDHTARLWNVRDTQPLGEPLRGHNAPVRTVAFSPDGHILATAGNDETIRLWNVTAEPRVAALGAPLTGHNATVHSVAFSPDGRTLATAGNDKTIRLWNVTNPAQTASRGLPLIGHTGPVWSVKFSPDGRMLATGSEDSTARLWNVTEPNNATPLGQPLTAGTSTVFAVDFSPHGHTLATGGLDSVVRLWSIPTTVLVGHTAKVPSLTFRPDGHVLATGAADSTVRLWDVGDQANPKPWGTPLIGHSGPVWSVKFSPDGRILASGSGDKTVRLWDVHDPARIVPLGQPITLRTRYVAPLAFSPDGRTLATGSDDKTIQLWDIHDPNHPTTLGRPLTGHTEYVNSVAFSPDGHTLATASSDKTIQLWNVTDPANPVRLENVLAEHSGPVMHAVFSPDGRTLATGSDDKTIRLWDISDPNHPTTLGRPLTGHTENVHSVAFSPDGHTLATASSDKTIRLWNVTDPAKAAPLGGPFTERSETGYFLAFSPDGQFLATGSDDAIRLWDLDADRAVQRICDTTRGVLTPELWRQHISQHPYEPPCA